MQIAIVTVTITTVYLILFVFTTVYLILFVFTLAIMRSASKPTPKPDNNPDQKS